MTGPEGAPGEDAAAAMPAPRDLAAALAVQMSRRTGFYVDLEDVGVTVSPLGVVVAVRGAPVARLWSRERPGENDAETFARAVLDRAPDLYARVRAAVADGPEAAAGELGVAEVRSRILAACHRRFYGAFAEDVVVYDLVKDATGVLDGLSVVLMRGVQGPASEPVDEASVVRPDGVEDEEGPELPVERRDDGVHVIRMGAASSAVDADAGGDTDAAADADAGPVVGVRVSDGKGLVVEEPLDPGAKARDVDVRQVAERLFQAVVVRWSGDDEAQAVREVEQRLRVYGEAFVVPAERDPPLEPMRYRMTIRRVSAGLDLPHVVLHGADDLTLIRRRGV